MTLTADIHARRDELRRRFPVWRPRTLSDWLDDCAYHYGDRPMVLTDDRELSYADVATESRLLADGLVALDVQPGDRVGMIIANYPEFVTIKFAISRAGAIAVPLNYLYRSDELVFVLADAGCRVVITMTGFADLDYQAALDRMRGQTTVIVLDTDGCARSGVLTVQGLAALGEKNLGASDGRSVDPGEPGDMLYTSGTTGSPKGVLVSHDAVLRTAYASALTRAYEDGRRILFSLPCYHMFGYVEGLLSAGFVGGAVILQTSFSAAGYFAGIQRHRATDILCVPTMAVAMVEYPARSDYDLSSLTAMLCGSAPAPIWLWKQIAATLHQGWLHSGDLGVVRNDGYLQITGRSKELYKSGGELVMLKEIEDLLAAHDAISQVFVIGLPDERWGEIGCVVVVPAPGSVLTEADVLATCRTNLARFKVPKRVAFYRADDLPTTPTGKVQKFRLVQQLTSAQSSLGLPLLPGMTRKSS